MVVPVPEPLYLCLQKKAYGIFGEKFEYLTRTVLNMGGGLGPPRAPRNGLRSLLMRRITSKSEKPSPSRYDIF